jgi:glycosyltransferase involved in cell wall biosynthesis
MAWRTKQEDAVSKLIRYGETPAYKRTTANETTSMIMAIDAFRLLAEPLASIGVYLSELVRSLHTLPEVQKLYLLFPRKPAENFIHQKLAELKNVEFVYPTKDFFPERNFLSEICWTHLIVPSLIRANIKSANYYLAPYHHPPIFLRRGIHVLTIVHDLCGLRSDCGYRKTGRGFYQHLFRFVMAAIRSDCFVPISQYTKTQFINRFPFLAGRISNVVYNGVSCLPVSDEILHETLHKYGLHGKRYFVGFGSPSIRKGIDLIIDSYKAYKDRGGDGSLLLITARYYHDAVVRLLDKEGLTAVSILSDVANSERDSLYRGAVALLFPSRCEGFGYPVLEAMRQGCPPIVRHEGPMSEIVGCGLSLLEELTVEQIVSHMTMFENVDAHARAELSERLVRRSLVFTGESFGHNLLSAIKERRSSYLNAVEEMEP